MKPAPQRLPVFFWQAHLHWQLPWFGLLSCSDQSLHACFSGAFLLIGLSVGSVSRAKEKEASESLESANLCRGKIAGIGSTAALRLCATRNNRKIASRLRVIEYKPHITHPGTRSSECA